MTVNKPDFNLFTLIKIKAYKNEKHLTVFVILGKQQIFPFKAAMNVIF